ncbi:membrane protein containing TraG-like protein, partial [mine drainage metagenome]
MTFFEGVIYGMAPFLAFLIPLGPMGFRYVGRYLQVLVWIFLWMPLLSFVNLFEIMAVLREMNALSPAIGNLPLISAVGINQIEYTVSDWIGIGGYLATAAIGFSGFVVFGAVAAFQGIAAEANAPTSLNPGPLAPDMMNVAPPVSIGGVYQAQAGSALAMAGASNLVFSGSQQIALTKQHALND